MREIFIACSIPSALVGLAIWYFQRIITKNEKKRDEQERNIENLVLLIIQAERANTDLCVATAEALRDGHCDGNMTIALENVKKIEKAEKEFMLEKSIQHIFQ